MSKSSRWPPEVCQWAFATVVGIIYGLSETDTHSRAENLLQVLGVSFQLK